MQDSSSSWTLDHQSMVGIYGQLVGHGASWARQVASGTPLSQVLTLESLFWAGFNIASETLSRTASVATGTETAGILAPAAVQVAALNMYNGPAKRAISDVSGGNVMALLDSPFLAGSLGSVIAKSYF